MRFLLCLLFLASAACSQQPAETSLVTGIFAGQVRDRLCIAGEEGAYRAGFIAFGNGDVNCSAAGRLEGEGSNWTLVPKGEGPCRIPLTIEGNAVKLSQTPTACSYYCGPGASMAGKSFGLAAQASEATDLAGDPLC